MYRVMHFFDPRKIRNVGVQQDFFRYNTDHFRPPWRVTIVRTHPHHLLAQTLKGRIQGWVVKTEQAPNHKISYEGTPRAIWYAVETQTVIFLAFVVIDYSGWVHDDSAWTIAMARMKPGDEINLQINEDGQLYPEMG